MASSGFILPVTALANMSTRTNLLIASVAAALGGPAYPGSRLILLSSRKILSLGSSGHASGIASRPLKLGMKYERPVFVQGTRNFLSKNARKNALAPSGLGESAKPAHRLML